MRITIIGFVGLYAICKLDDNFIIDIKTINIPREAKKGDILNIDNSPITIEKQIGKVKYVHVDNVIIDIW